jgi:hypothetical protein
MGKASNAAQKSTDIRITPRSAFSTQLACWSFAWASVMGGPNMRLDDAYSIWGGRRKISIRNFQPCYKKLINDALKE